MENGLVAESDFADQQNAGCSYNAGCRESDVAIVTQSGVWRYYPSLLIRLPPSAVHPSHPAVSVRRPARGSWPCSPLPWSLLV